MGLGGSNNNFRAKNLGNIRTKPLDLRASNGKKNNRARDFSPRTKLVPYAYDESRVCKITCSRHVRRRGCYGLKHPFWLRFCLFSFFLLAGLSVYLYTATRTPCMEKLRNFFEEVNKSVGAPPPPPPRWASFSGLTQHHGLHAILNTPYRWKKKSCVRLWPDSFPPWRYISLKSNRYVRLRI